MEWWRHQIQNYRLAGGSGKPTDVLGHPECPAGCIPLLLKEVNGGLGAVEDQASIDEGWDGTQEEMEAL